MNKRNSLLSINNLKVSIAEKIIISGLNLTINHGEVHAIMGPNGSGKSTLAKTLAGHPECNIHAGSINYLGTKIIDLSVEERANKGIFLGFQYPIEIPGLSNTAFLKAALNAQRKSQGDEEITAVDFLKELKHNAEVIGMDQAFLNRGVNEGFSGGEKKRNEILQMMMLKPRLSILDETDSGLDIDAMKTVANGLNSMRKKDSSFLLITHYDRLLGYIKPDFVHVLSKGRIIQSGDSTLANKLEEKGYEWLTKTK
ncbi:MAG: Fe-S cluster assembly ATPase SufC [Gammaproteobacteria bacterium]|jgi:Fe-S cluster assembly ATP-binding protein|nr:Fe-S cluster assembly ATPase SufC [Gammaproteobacteria bacterium]